MKTAGICVSLLRASWFCAPFVALALAACSSEPLGEDVVAQAQADGQIAFDVVKIDDAVLKTLLARPPPAFQERFKKHLPPADLKIAVGDRVSVVIWESADNGLFGNSLTELSFPAGAASSLLGSRAPSLTGVPSQPGGLAASPEILARLFGGTATQGVAGGLGGSAAQDGMAALGGAATLSGAAALGGALGGAAGPDGTAGLGLAGQASTLAGSLFGGGSVTGTGNGATADSPFSRASGSARG